MRLSIIQLWLAIMFIICPGLTAQSNWSGNIEWSGTDVGGIDVSSGLYFYRIEASNYSKTYKMVFVK